MALIICPGCGHSAELERAPRGKFCCSRCGAKSVRIIRYKKIWQAPRVARPVEQARRHTYWALRYFGQEKGYREGWAGMKFKAMYGDWPSNEDRVPFAEDISPCEDLLAWINAQNAKRSAQRRKEKQHGQETVSR